MLAAATLAAAWIGLAQARRVCYTDCGLEAWGQVNCITDDFTNSYCCRDDDTSCLSRYRFCTRGLTKNDYFRLTCPTIDCPKALIYKH